MDHLLQEIYGDKHEALLPRIERNIVEQTLSYALCRKLTRSDQAVVDTISENLCENKGTWSSLFQQVANSVPFQETMIEATSKDDE
jgi:hypothetical protein